ncbi:hypothetical protein LXA47_03840 [Massilia sp. P8910]|uniref:hypothetical protein n=1 Tax=Massilia antarctica TaxID=2765360 RepID=UPI001E53276E|nr:hypothetical protein [Massilia antarctica]MCE3602730.1 hypothetical protein [Massilia antarctica]
MKSKYIFPTVMGAMSAGLAAFYLADGEPVMAALFCIPLLQSLWMAAAIGIQASRPALANRAHEAGIVLGNAVIVALAVAHYLSHKYWLVALLSSAFVLNLLVWQSHRIVMFVLHGEKLPRFYGVAWDSLHRPGAYCAPIPLNLLIGWAHAAWCYLKLRGVKMPLTVHQAYAEGLRAGHVVQEKHFN